MAGNWKMNLNHPEAVALVQKLAWILADKKHDFARTEVAVLPPYTDLRSVQTLVDGDRLAIRYGAPGRVSARLRCLHRRDLRGDAGEAGLLLRGGRPLGAAGVPRGERRAGQRQGRRPPPPDDADRLCGRGARRTQAGEQVPYTLAQVDGSLAGFLAEGDRVVVIAYEPVWAIGTGEVATPDDAQEVCAAIREPAPRDAGDEAADGCRVLYGGSVKAANIAGIMAQSRTSTVRSWAAPASRPRSSAGSAASTTCPPCDASPGHAASVRPAVGRWDAPLT